MRWTSEQKAILQSDGDIKVNAVAGSGKTTTIIEYARSRPANSRILYLAFNKSVKLEAAKIFKEEGLDHVRVETAHSLAYRDIVFRFNYKVRGSGYKTHELAKLLNLPGADEKHGQYIIANHVNKFTAFFCNSNASKVQSLNYLNTISDTKARTFVSSFYDIIEKQTRIFLAMMNAGHSAATDERVQARAGLLERRNHYLGGVIAGPNHRDNRRGGIVTTSRVSQWHAALNGLFGDAWIFDHYTERILVTQHRISGCSVIDGKAVGYQTTYINTP